MPFYLGKRGEDDLIQFDSIATPTKQTHGHLYKAVIGPSQSWSMLLCALRKKTTRTSVLPLTRNTWRADPRMELAIIEESLTDDELTIARECDAQTRPNIPHNLPSPCRSNPGRNFFKHKEQSHA